MTPDEKIWRTRRRFDSQPRLEILRAGAPRFDDQLHYMEWASEGFAYCFSVEGDEIVISD